MHPHLLHPHAKHLVLIGGGHSHVIVIKQLGMNPLPEIRITLISENTYTPYSGMLPGLIAGHYNFDDCHIDLRKLCQWAGIRFICNTVKRLDPEEKKIICHQYPSLSYDLLSINTGSQPRLHTINGALQYGHAVKPVKDFLSQWQQWLKSSAATSKTNQILMVGGGAAGVEVLLAMHYHIHSTSKIRSNFTLICSDKNILSTHNKRVQDFFLQHLNRLGIKIITNQKVTAITAHQVLLTDSQTLDADFVTLAIDAGAQSWLTESGVQCDNKGFIQVDKYLRSISHPDIFAVGDSAAFTPSPLPKAGVYAVRQGPILTRNLIATLKKHALRPFKPQHRFLSLLATGERHAVASRGPLFATGKWVWYWKNHIDRKFMARFNPTPMTASNNSDDIPFETMRCGGCGAKINSSILQNVLTKLDIQPNPDVVNGLGDDAAIINVPAEAQWVQSVDFFRHFINDPYLFGRIASIHCLGDIYAMGAKPHSALVTAVIPYSQTAIMEETLRHLMLGILTTLNNENTTLIGGHSGEGNELAVGLTVNGTLTPGQALTKSGFRHGDNLILTKPIGTGVLLAANMAANCQGRWLDNAVTVMLQSNQTAASILRTNDAHGCTDVTGFGLLGHLQEILTASQCGATLILDNIPVLDGAIPCSAQGIKSTLYNANKQSNSHQNYKGQHPIFPLLFDPQTAGGLLAGIPAHITDNCLRALADAGYTAAKIGRIDKQLSTNVITFID
jgi:selenide, water dikinase